MTYKMHELKAEGGKDYKGGKDYCIRIFRSILVTPPILDVVWVPRTVGRMDGRKGEAVWLLPVQCTMTELVPGKTGRLLRQWSNTTHNALLDQVITTEALKRVTERAEDARQGSEGAIHAAWNRLESLFLLCNGLSETGYPAGAGADVVLVVAREGEDDQLIYGHRAVFAASPVLSKLMMHELQRREEAASDTADSLLRIPLPHFEQTAEIVFQAIRLLYSGKAFRRPPGNAKEVSSVWVDRNNWKICGVPTGAVPALEQVDALKKKSMDGARGYFEMKDALELRTVEEAMKMLFSTDAGRAAAKTHIQHLHSQADPEQSKQEQWESMAGLSILLENLQVREEAYFSTAKPAGSADDVLTPFEMVYEHMHMEIKLRPEKTSTGFFEQMMNALVEKHARQRGVHTRTMQLQRLCRPDCVLRSTDFDPAAGTGWELPCHVFVLLAWSDFFQSMLLGTWNDSKIVVDENHGRVVVLHHEVVASKQTAQVLCSAMYTQSLTICGSNVQLCADCRGAAEYFQLHSIVHGLDQVMVSALSDDTCLGILEWSVAVESAAWVNRMGKRYLRTHFVRIFQKDERLTDLSREDMEACIASDFLQAEEWMVLATLLRWSELRVQSGAATSITDDIAGLVEHVRLPFIDPIALEHVFETLATPIERPKDCFPHCMWDEVREFQSWRGPDQGLQYVCEGCGEKVETLEYYSHKPRPNRYRCMVCPDFDLCRLCFDACVTSGDHVPEHEMRPVQSRAAQIEDNSNPRFRLRFTDALADLLVGMKEQDLEGSRRPFHLRRGRYHQVRWWYV